MFGIEHYPLFLLSGILLNITPGSDTIYILGRTMSQGRSAGMMSVLGIVSGAVAHTMFAAAGLSIILMKSAALFQVMKWAGAGYLIYLGIRSILAKPVSGVNLEDAERTKLRRIYVQGFLTNLLNPKVALFYLAFLPQFIQANNDYGALPFFILGLTFITTGTLWCMLLVIGSDLMSRRLRKSSLSSVLNKASGVIFIGLGIQLLRANRG
ncbi:LysE family translocator [Paenibacillus kobensis]|uniref:LysE family translocator n=1 Tax=Paenibacillus kobensis TaxID=59841 RepID=UPI000FD7A221|nr:LysE family translocator [Paenibacillus kobensis]